jgi:hypothetical protein
MANALTPFAIVSRVAAGLLGSYAFVWGAITLCTILLVAAGVRYGEALTLMYLLAFLVFLVCFCWAFAAASLVRVWSILAGGGVVMSLAAWLIARGLAH